VGIKYDINSFNDANDPAATGIEFSYFEPHLDIKTAVLAKGHDAVCIFVNDVVNSQVLRKLKEHGIVRIAIS
jgi:D-lactate dehydrogenase